MKIMLLNPDSGMTQEEFDIRCEILKKYCGPDVQLAMECITESDISLDSVYEQVLAGPELVKRAIKAEKKGYDAVILYCFSDPALEACQEVLHIPVIGAGMAACHTASFISRQCGLLLTEKKRIPEKITYCQQRGFMPSPIIKIGSVSMDGANVWNRREEVVDKLESACRKMIEEDGVEAVIIGCLSYLDVAQDIATRIGIPVIDAAIAAVAQAESLVRQKLFISKASYPDPRL